MLDVVVTVLLSLLTLGAGAAALFSSPFLLMVTDSAGDSAENKPNLKPLGWAYAFIYTAVAAGVLVAAVGIVKAARHHTTMWHWPAAGLAIVAVGYGLGLFLASRVVRKTS